MICPQCGADTQVVDSRPEADGKVIRRRRRCVAEACGYRFSSWESTLNVTARRKRAAAATAAYRSADPKRAKAQDMARAKTRSIRNQARAEAKETGRRVEDVLAAWGVVTRPRRCGTPATTG